jgi:hypothetical protein
MEQPITSNDYFGVEIYHVDQEADQKVSGKRLASEDKNNFTFDELSDYFCMPFHSAAVALGIYFITKPYDIHECLSTLKLSPGLHDTQLQRICRKAKITNWPYKKVHAMCKTSFSNI